MAAKKNSTPSSEERILVWPDFQSTFNQEAVSVYFDDLSHVIDSIFVFKFEFERIIEDIDNIRDYSEKKWVDAVKQRFRRNKEEAEKRGNTEKAIMFSKLIANWNAMDNVALIKELYRKCMELLNAYLFAYQDIYERQRCRTLTGKKYESIVTPYFKMFPEQISKALNMELTYETRLKTWYSFVQKLITRAESLDSYELETFYDIYGCKFIVSNGVPKVIDGKMYDYASAEMDCYKIANQVIYSFMKIGAEPLISRNVGPVSELIKPEYRKFLKDYINNPKPNNYQALHIAFSLCVAQNENLYIIFEVQIQSKVMALRSKTEASHLIYKQNSKLDLKFDPTLVILSDFLAKLVDRKLEIEDTGGLLIPKELCKKKTYYKS